MFLVYCMCGYLIIGGLKDHLGVPRECVQAVSLCLSKVSLQITLSENMTCQKVFNMKWTNLTVTTKQFTVTVICVIVMFLQKCDKLVKCSILCF